MFRPFLSDLQKLRAVLEADPTLARIDAAKGLILAAQDEGRQVQQGLDRILAELNSMTAMLRPPGTAAKRAWRSRNAAGLPNKYTRRGGRGE